MVKLAHFLRLGMAGDPTRKIPLELEVELIHMELHHIHLARSGDGIMISEVEDREEIELVERAK